MRLPALLAAAVVSGCGGEPERLEVESRLLERTVEHVVVDPGGAGRPLLVLLHGRGWDPDDVWTLGLREELERLGRRAPAVVVVDGGDSSYYHDRRNGAWGGHVVREAIPAAVHALEADGSRVAIGGFSMGGFGALDLARLQPRRFCAAGGHSPALWRTGGETPAGAFNDAEDFAHHDLARLQPRRFCAAGVSPPVRQSAGEWPPAGAFNDAEDFAHHDLFGGPFGGDAAVWIDVGRADPFLEAATAYAARLRAHGRSVELRVWPGGHDREYWKAHLRDYLGFYARALARC
jgi:S-formylglutathione hydrolase FrmB